MKHSNTIKRLLSVALALVMVLSLAATAFAEGSALPDEEDGYTITINPNENTTQGSSVSGRYHAFQIFAGTVDDGTHEVEGVDATPAPNYDDGTHPRDEGNTKIMDPNSNTLSDITWGSAIVKESGYDLSEELVNALLNDETFGPTLEEELKKAGYEVEDKEENGEWSLTDTNKHFSDPKVAQAVADALAQKPGFVRDFADIVGALLEDSDYYASTWETDVQAGEDTPEEGHWEVGPVPGGYYLIQDTYDRETGNKAQSEFILVVAGDADVEVKSDVPTNTKEIIPPTNDANGEEGSGTSKGDVAGVGDDVTFRLTGTLPENYSEYDTYKYVFHDKMSDGLTFHDELENVYVIVPNKDGQFDGGDNDPFGMPTGTKYDIYVIDENNNGYHLDTDPQDDDCTFEVAFGDITGDPAKGLKALQGRKATGTGEDGNYTFSQETGDVPVNKDSKVIVEYTVTVNEDAAWQNENESHLEFSNNPEWDQDGNEPTGNTPEDKVYVYTFGLDNHKIGIEDDEDGLEGAGFQLSKTVTEPNPAYDPDTPGGDEEEETIEVTYYAVFTWDEENNAYTIAGWVTEEQLETATTKSIDEMDKDDWTAAYEADDFSGATLTPDDAEEYYLVAMSDEEGDFTIWGLDEGTYTMSEKVTPNGYNTMDDFDITITADVEDDGSLGGDSEATSDPAENPIVDDSHMEDDGWIDLTLKNTKTLLPGTGGSGVYMFYAAGILLLAGAVAYLLLSGKKNGAAAAK